MAYTTYIANDIYHYKMNHPGPYSILCMACLVGLYIGSYFNVLVLYNAVHKQTSYNEDRFCHHQPAGYNELAQLAE